MSLDDFWRFLETRPGGAAVAIEWERRCGQGFPAIRRLLRATSASASMYPAPVPGRPPMRVVQHSDGTIVAICDQGRSECLTLTKPDVALHAVDRSVLRGHLCDGLGLRTARDPIGSLPGALRIGSWDPQPSVAFPVALVVVRDEAALRMALHELTLALRKPAILLTPTRDLWHDGVLSMAEERKATLVPACEVIEAEGEGWAASEEWPRFQGAFLARAGVTLPSPFTNKRKPRKRQSRATAIDAIKRAIREHLVAARDHARTTAALGEPKLLPRPLQSQLARQLGLSESTVSRVLTREPDAELKLLWNSATDLDAVRRYRG